MNRSILLLIFAIIFVGCSSNREHFETFFIGNNQSQYFIKPIEMESKSSDFSIDFTIRQVNEDELDITSNFTIISDYPISKIDSVILNNKYQIYEIDKLYLESIGDQFKLRSSMKVEYDFIIEFFTQEMIDLSVYSNEHMFNYKIETSSDKEIKSIEQKLLPILNSIIDN